MCKIFSYDDIQKWLKWFCELNIYNHFKEIFNFFFHPMIFWTHYDGARLCGYISTQKEAAHDVREPPLAI